MKKNEKIRDRHETNIHDQCKPVNKFHAHRQIKIVCIEPSKSMAKGRNRARERGRHQPKDHLSVVVNYVLPGIHFSDQRGTRGPNNSLHHVACRCASDGSVLPVVQLYAFRPHASVHINP